MRSKKPPINQQIHDFLTNKPPEIIDKSLREYSKWLEYDNKHPIDINRRLLVVLPFNFRESLLGYLMRLGEANHYDTNGVIASALIENAYNWTDYHTNIATGRFNIPALARLLGVGTADVYIMTYTVLKETTTKEPGTIVIDSFEYPLELARVKKPRVCVECFKEAKVHPDQYPFHKRIWDLAHYTVCTKHYTLLEDICPKCNKQLSWARKKLTLCQCGYDLCNIKPIKVPLEQTLLSARVSLSLEDGEDPNDEQINALEKGYFTDLLQQISAEVPVPDGYTEYPSEITDEILEREQQQHAYSRKKTRFCYTEMPNEILHRHFASLYPDLFGKNSINLSSNNYEITTKVEAARIIGMSITSFDSFKDAFPPANDEFYNKQELLYLAALYRKLLPTTKTCNLLGISEHMLRSLDKCGITAPLFGPEINGYGDYLYHKDDLQQLLNRLNDKIIKFVGDETLITIGEYSDLAVSHRLPFSDLVVSILNHKLPLYDFDKKMGLRSLTFSRQDLIDINQVHLVNDELLGIEEVAEILSIYSNAVFRTITSGFLNPIELRINKTVKKYVSKQELERFQANFIFVSEIAKNYQCNSTNLTDKIVDEGVRPVSGPGIDNNLIYIFKRKDIDKLDMKFVIQKKGYQTKTGRPKKGTPSKWDDHPLLIDATAIAEQLETTVQKVSRLARDGYLKPYDHKGVLGNKRLFEVSQFQAYLKAFQKNPDLVNLSDALIEIGENEEHFKANWVRSRRIAFVEDGLEGLYLKRNQLDEIVKFKDYAMSTRDIVEQMRVERSVVQNKHKLGYLTPISGPGIDEFGNFFYDKHDIRVIFSEFCS